MHLKGLRLIFDTGCPLPTPPVIPDDEHLYSSVQYSDLPVGTDVKLLEGACVPSCPLQDAITVADSTVWIDAKSRVLGVTPPTGPVRFRGG